MFGSALFFLRFIKSDWIVFKSNHPPYKIKVRPYFSNILFNLFFYFNHNNYFYLFNKPPVPEMELFCMLFRLSIILKLLLKGSVPTK